jgi:hypothetical protein
VPRPLAVAIAAALAFSATHARAADLSSWLALGGGYGFERNDVESITRRGAAFSATLGVGTTPRNRFVVGGVFRSLTHLTLGTDISIGPRVAPGGFARGDWGLALDAAAAGRFWKHGDFGRFPVQVVLTGGTPWGFQLGVGADVWNIAGDPPARGVFALLEFDLLRFTLMRQGTSEAWWRNPAPAGGHLDGGDPTSKAAP